MRVLQLNIFGNLSTGRIAVDLYRTLVAEGGEGKVAFARNSIAQGVPFVKIGTDMDVKLHALMTRITDRTGFFSKRATKKLLQEIDRYQPDIIHLHNIHGYYLHVGVLFDYLKKKQIPVVWTLHDCWAFTGHCCYFSMAGCEKWKTSCAKCPQKSAYPASKLMDSSAWNYKKKKDIFLGVNLSLVTVSKWLENTVKQSFLKNYPVRTIYNGVDLNKFKPIQSDFRERYGLTDKIILLGVASTWDIRKGLKDFVQISNMLDEKFQIVLVGLNEREKKDLPKNILAISRTDSIEELAKIYTAADVFFNASVEETFGLPTVEALACGTPVIVYNATALPEVVDNTCGFVVDKHDLNAVKEILIQKKYLALGKEDCLNAAKKYEKDKQYKEYIALYKEILEKKGVTP